MCLSLHCILSSITGPYILRIIFLSNFLSAFSSVTVKVHVSVPYVATCLSNVLYTCSLAALDILTTKFTKQRSTSQLIKS
jgi:hypothetical protein